MAEIIHILAANICRQFFFVIITSASTCCLVENFQLANLLFAASRVCGVLGNLTDKIFKIALWPNRFFVKPTKARTATTEQSQFILH